MREALSIEQYRSRIGKEIGVSDWFLVDQTRIDRFADVTEDWNAIHIDPEQARDSGLEGTIAHGFLSVSLLAAMVPSAVPAMEGITTVFNYGFNSLRFLAPVCAGKRVRGRFALKDCSERSPGKWRVVLGVSVEIEDEPKPALVAEWLILNRTN